MLLGSFMNSPGTSIFWVSGMNSPGTSIHLGSGMHSPGNYILFAQAGTK
jgi:hypothetical protein